MRDKLLSLPRYQKHLLILAVDTLSIWLALTLAFSVRLGWGDFYGHYQPLFITLLFLAPVVSLPIYIRFGLYSAVLRYMSHQVLLTILKAAVASILMLIAVFYLLGINNMPRGNGIVLLLLWPVPQLDPLWCQAVVERLHTEGCG